MIRFFVSSLILLFASVSAQAQMSSDALFFSERLQLNTARSAATGNALGALGGDMTTLNHNPAGMAIYRSSEFLFTPGMQFANVKSTFVSDSTLPQSRNSRVSFNFGSIGLILAQDLSEDWKYVNFGLSYSKIASFNRTLSFNGLSTGSRIINFTEEANASASLPDNLDPFEEQLAWDAYFIDNPSGGTDYVGAVVDSNLSYIEKNQVLRQSGGINELAISLAGNYLHKFYIGGTVGIDFLRFRDLRSYNETEPTGNMDFKSLAFNEDRDVKGTGVNLKIGMIYRINKRMRMGLSVHTPTIYSITERLNTDMSGAVVWNDTLRELTFEERLLSPTAEYKHNFTSPFLLSLSLGSTFGNKTAKVKGFMGVDADYLNYAAGSFALKALDVNATASDQAYIDRVNSAIEDSYSSVFRVRVGGELAMGSLRLRAGYRLQSSPYRQQIAGLNDFRQDISFGLGIRQQFIFFDIAYVQTLMDFEYAPYYATSDTNNPRTLNELSNGLFLATIGFRF